MWTYSRTGKWQLGSLIPRILSETTEGLGKRLAVLVVVTYQLSIFSCFVKS